MLSEFSDIKPEVKKESTQQPKENSFKEDIKNSNDDWNGWDFDDCNTDKFTSSERKTTHNDMKLSERTNKFQQKKEERVTSSKPTKGPMKLGAQKIRKMN